ncbi:asparagine synthase [Actinoplanes aureus]|uniref:asparagine synthase (glutamine-hydrolyzing) n=1 Tax=Actinoplanes aureus TaxID=2792083 RepID=A0A931CMR4_9ACTN|nr:asparagine synthase [Actinoplanes aureus]MBG0567760.1 asparagine synthase [Actinoplanes aureus]
MSGYDGPPSFLVLPDNEALSEVARHPLLTASGIRTLRHPSGRPWIIGRWSTDELVASTDGPVRVALFGQTGATTDSLASHVTGAASVTALDPVHDIPGSFHIVAAAGDTLRVQGTASGWRRVHHARINGCTVAASRADLLAGLVTATPSLTALAVRLLEPVLYPFGETSMWDGVDTVAPQDYLLVTEAGRQARHRRWWSVPEPSLSLTEGAQAVRAALAAAVDARLRPGERYSTDLSGGYDSTAMAFLAAGHGADLTACTSYSDDPSSDELGWARRAAARLPLREHVLVPASELTLPYADMAVGQDRLEAPSIIAVFRGRALSTIRRMAETGSTLHLTGFGGDNLFTGNPAHLHGLITRAPGRAIHDLRGYRALFSWRRRELVRQVLDRRSWRAAMRAVSLDDRDVPDITVPWLGWVSQPRVPRWLTPAAREIIIEAIRAAAGSEAPLAADRGLHHELNGLRASARDVSSLDMLARTTGIPLAAPFFDDHVVDAAFAVRSEERVTPYAYKPLLAEAMRGIVPDECLERQTKAQGATELEEGLRHEHAAVAGLWEDSRLAELGLVDADALRRLCATPSAPELVDGALFSTLACESWLRALPSPVHSPDSMGVR